MLQECKSRKEKLYIAWIDYEKAFDRVPHSWVLKSIELIPCKKAVTNNNNTKNKNNNSKNNHNNVMRIFECKTF